METTTSTQAITIINRTDGGVTAHRTGCRDIRREVAGTHADHFELGDFASQRDVFLCYNADFLEEGQSEDEVYRIDFKPCCDLPATTPEVETHAHNGAGQGCPQGDAQCSPAYLCRPCCTALIAEAFGATA